MTDAPSATDTTRTAERAFGASAARPRPQYVGLNGEVVPWDEGKVHISSGVFKFGSGVFEGVRGYWNEAQAQLYLFRMAEHMQRLEFSQRFMRFEPPISAADMTRWTLDVIRANALRETIHIMTTAFIESGGPPAVRGKVGGSVLAMPGVGYPFRDRGCHVQVSSWQRLADQAMPVRVKCNANYQNGRLATLQARDDGYDTVLMLNSRGKIAEGPGMCFFIILGERVITPSTSSDILESITRDTVLTLLGDEMGMSIEERSVDRSELALADEAFFCGTAWEVTPIATIDRLPLGAGEEPGPVTRAMQKRYFDVVSGATPDWSEWRLPVYNNSG